MRAPLLATTLVAAIALASMASCSSSSPSSSAVHVVDVRTDAAVAIRPDDATAVADRAACKFARGAMPATTLGKSTPIDAEIPIEHIVVVMMENHSFDSYFGRLNQYAHRTDVESATDGTTNPDTTGGPQPWTHAQHLCTLDTDHGWAGTHKEIDDGKMDGFAQVNEGFNASALPATSTDPSLSSGGRSLWWYDERDLPFYYKLASTFAIADHYFCSVPGPTWPNRKFLFAATSFGATVTPGGSVPITFPDLSAYPFPGNNPATVLDELESSHTSWMYYSDSSLSSLLIVYAGQTNTRWKRSVIGTFADFQKAAQAGTLPAVSFVDPNLASESSNADGLDEHPPGDIQSGQKFVSDVVHAVTSSPEWAHTALFITHDEHGGFYDHVAPPKACSPDSIAPILVAGDTTAGGFDSYGVRVVLIAVSPYAKKAYVGHHVYDHTSITRFIEAKFKLPALTARDANADPLTDLFDFSKPTFATPPALDAPTIDPNELAYCQMTYGQ
jgi:phospholipase C